MKNHNQNPVAVKRQEANLTQAALGEQIGLSSVSICLIERGRCLPRLDTLQRLAGALDVEAVELGKELLSWKASLQ